MKPGTRLLSIALCLPTGLLVGQGLATDAWPTYAGDYSQRRYSTLRQIDQTNARHLTLAWLRRLTAGPDAGEGSWFGRQAPQPGEGQVPRVGLVDLSERAVAALRIVARIGRPCVRRQPLAHEQPGRETERNREEQRAGLHFKVTRYAVK